MADGEGGRLGKLIKLVVGILLLVLIGVGGYYAYVTFIGGGEGEMSAGSSEIAPTRSNGGSIENPQYLELGDFTVNLADGRRYLRTKLQLLLSEEQAKEYLSVRMAEVKDIVVAQLQTLTSEQLRDGKSRAQMRKEILKKIKSILPNERGKREWDDPDPIKRLLITEFYLQ